MTSSSTTIRVSVEQRDRLRRLAEDRHASMADTFDAAIESLRRQQFYDDMARSEAVLRSDAAGWAEYRDHRDQWLNADASTP